MCSRRICILVLALGLIMVWLGVLFTYETKVLDRKATAVEQANAVKNPAAQIAANDVQALEFTEGDAVIEAGAGFPLALAGLGMVFLLGGAFSYRNLEQHKLLKVK